MYAYFDGGLWERYALDTYGDVGGYTGIDTDTSNNPHISYVDYDNIMLKYAWFGDEIPVEDIELTTHVETAGLLLSWTYSGDVPASVRVLRGESDPVAVSGSLDGATRRWLDRGVEPGESYVYWLEATDSEGYVTRFGPTEAVVVPEEAHRLALDEPWPNPAANSVSIAFELPEPQSVSLAVYDLAGRRVATLSEGELPAGRHTVSWNCAGESSGVYLLRLETAGAALSRRVVIGRVVDR